MAPLILDEEEAVDEDEDHGDNDHQHHHQAAVQVLQSTQRAPHLGNIEVIRNIWGVLCIT